MVIAAVSVFIGCSPKEEEAVGGYTEQRELTAEDTALFDGVMAQAGDGKVYEPVSVATQVVAGTNYCFKTNVTDGDETYEANIYIFEPLPSDAVPTSCKGREALIPTQRRRAQHNGMVLHAQTVEMSRR